MYLDRRQPLNENRTNVNIDNIRLTVFEQQQNKIAIIFPHIFFLFRYEVRVLYQSTFTFASLPVLRFVQRTTTK